MKHQVRVGSQYCDPASAGRVVAVFLKAVRFNELTQLIEVDPAVCTQHAAATCFVYEKRTMIRKELPVVRVIHEALEARNKRIVAKRVKERMGGAAAATAARARAAPSLSQGQSPALNADDWAGLLADCEGGQSQLATDGSLSSRSSSSYAGNDSMSIGSTGGGGSMGSLRGLPTSTARSAIVGEFDEMRITPSSAEAAAVQALVQFDSKSLSSVANSLSSDGVGGGDVFSLALGIGKRVHVPMRTRVTPEGRRAEDRAVNRAFRGNFPMSGGSSGGGGGGGGVASAAAAAGRGGRPSTEVGSPSFPGSGFPVWPGQERPAIQKKRPVMKSTGTGDGVWETYISDTGSLERRRRPSPHVGAGPQVPFDGH